MIGDAEETVDRNGQPDFFQRFADSAVLDAFHEMYFSAGDAPAFRFGRKFSQRQQHAAGLVYQECACPDSWLGPGGFECFCGPHRSRLDTHLATEGSGAVFNWDKRVSTLSCTMTISL